MTFFYDLNKKLDEIRATPSKTHGQLNERDMSRAAKGYEKYGKQGMEALAKAGRDGKALDPVRAKYDKYDNTEVDEGMGDMVRKVGSMAKKVASNGLDKLTGGSDADQIRDLQRKMGVPQTGMKPGNEPNPKLVKEKMSPAKTKSFAALAEPKDKITFADKIAGAKKEVDEMLGDVAAEAIKSALSPKQKKIDMNKNGKLDANDFAMLRKGGNKQETTEEDDNNPFTSYKKPRAEKPRVGSIERGHKHDIEHTSTGRKVTRRVDDQGNSVGADDAGDTEPQKRGRGRPAGTGSKMGAKGPSGRSKLMTKENDFDPAEKGEYDQEGDMAKDSIKTVVRHAQALEKILGDNDNLPEWVQSKLAKIESMMTAVDDYMQNQEDDSEEMAMGEESTRKRDTHAEKAGKKVTKDIEYDEKKKDGIHGKKRGSEDDRAEKAGKKVAKDIEYDEKKDKKEDKPKKVKEQGGTDTPTASSGFSYGKGIYDSMNRELEKMIAESMSVNMSDSTEGGKSLTITATDEDALKLAGLLKNAGLGSSEGMGQEMGQGEESCPSCGMSSCGCGDVHETLDENNPDYPTDQTGTEDAMMYSGGLNGPKSTGQSTVPVLASQEDRQHTYEDDEALRRMMEMAGMNQANRLDEGIMDTIKSLVPKAIKLLGGDTAAQIAQQVKQATGGDFTPSRENAIKVAKALGFEEILKNKVGQEPQGQLAEAWGLAGNWQGKLIQLLYSVIPAAGIAGMAGAGPGGILGWWLGSVGIFLLMFADTFFSTDTGMVGAMGRNGRKGTDTGVTSEQDDLSRMMEMSGIQQDNLKPWEQTMKEEVEDDSEEDKLDEAEKCSACDCAPCECDESVTESFEQMLSRMRDIAGIKEAKKPDFLDMDKDGDKKEPMKKAVADKEKKVEESIFALTNQWKAYKG